MSEMAAVGRDRGSARPPAGQTFAEDLQRSALEHGGREPCNVLVIATDSRPEHGSIPVAFGVRRRRLEPMNEEIEGFVLDLTVACATISSMQTAAVRYATDSFHRPSVAPRR